MFPLVFFQKSFALPVLPVFNGKVTLESSKSVSADDFWKNLNKEIQKAYVKSIYGHNLLLICKISRQCLQNTTAAVDRSIEKI